ncbi:hypothetical protein DFR72_108300 [Lentzea flaviverrucosa]|uniref:Leucine rich repeat variant n=1 Tax=Lentzea flaviverrucosa TaxID=200379 RepID=A0A1H9T0P5_9PSEU|nr:hypothetical protein DFR72_108300 [Lentzea flaviverrucosa]SER90830.1 hypothetical protein SAMN05216195_107300 [Lentzea flaviverrucosa]
MPAVLPGRLVNAVLEGLASNPALPGYLLDRLVTRPGLAAELADRADLTPEHVRALLAHGDSMAVHRLLENGKVTPADVPIANESVALVLTGRPDADPALTRALAFHPDPSVRARLPESACSLPADVVALLARDPEPEVVAELVLFHALPPTLAESLSRHPSPDVLRALASSPHTPASVLARLPSGTLARELAANPATPPAAAADLLPHHASRYFLAGRPDLPAGVYEQLASELEPGILSHLAANPAVPVPVLRQLTGTRALRRVLLRNPAIPLDLLEDLAPAARIGPDLVPRIASASPAELRALAASPVAQVRMMVAARADLPPDLFTCLVLDDDPGVAGAVVVHPLVTVPQLWELASRHGSRLYPRVASNPLCPAELLHHMVLRAASVRETCRVVARHPCASGETLVLCSEDAQARHFAAAHPHLPVPVVVELLGSEFTAGAAAANPSLPVRVMEELVDGAGE